MDYRRIRLLPSALTLATALAACGDDSTAPGGPSGTRLAAPVSAGLIHSCAVTSDGTAYCWGDNSFGQVGNPEVPVDTAAPVLVVGAPPLVSVTTSKANSVNGPYFSCGLTTAGDTYCWGSNIQGELGDPDEELCPGRSGQPPSATLNTCNRTAVRLAAGVSFAKLSAGSRHICGVTTTARVMCWGASATGALGTGWALLLAPTPVTRGARYRDVSAGFDHTCAVRVTGEVDCWGLNDAGQLGDGTVASRVAPTRVRSTERFTQVSAGTSHTCAVTRTNRVFCWGSNESFRLGVFEQGVTQSLTPVEAAVGSDVRWVGAALNYTCALTTTDRAVCWGATLSGRGLGFPAIAGPEPLPVRGDLTFDALGVGTTHTCGRTTDGGTYCWGRNIFGAVGIGTRVSDAFEPARVAVP